MIPNTLVERDAAIGWLQNLNVQMRIAAIELRSVPPLGDVYRNAMAAVKRIAKDVDKYGSEPKPKKAAKKAKVKDPENLGAEN